MENLLRQRLKRGDFLLGSHICGLDASMTESMGNCGFDYLWLDTEHTAIDYGTLQLSLIAARAAGVPAIVRVPWNEPYLAKRVLDSGADGIVFPMIRSRAEAEKAVAACRYPPLGNRSFGPVRAACYGAVDGADFIRQETPCCFLQIEHIDAVHALDDILSVRGIDGLIFGPNDLSSSMGKLCQTDDQEVSEAMDWVISCCRDVGMPVGVSLGLPSDSTLLAWKARGIQMLSAGNEYCFMRKSAQTLLKLFGKGEIS